MPTQAHTPREPLLAEFPPVSPAEWRQLVETELKGAPFDRKMLTPTYEGITLQPIYHRDCETPHADSLPGFPPFVRGVRASGYLARPWEVSQEIATASAAEFNSVARHGLERGLTALNIVLDRATRNGADPDLAQPGDVGAGGLSLCSLEDLETAFDGIDLERVPVFIRSGASGMPVAALLAAFARRRGIDTSRLSGCIEIDPLGVLAHEGRLPQSLGEAYREMAALTSWAAEHAPRLQTICVHSRAWHEAGGNAVQELAFTLATSLEYLRAMHERGLGVDVVAPRIRSAYTVGERFFMEIAKLRAARMLWARLIRALGGGGPAQRWSLHVRTSLFNKTVYDMHTNILRTAVEAFAAVLGGCDSLQVGPFDEVLRPASEFSQRVARNQQFVLRDECHLTHVIDPAGGSWYVESLTHELARRAWELFQEIERQGGMTRAMQSGFPQREVGRVAAERLRNVALRRDVIVGVNLYANPAEPPVESVNVDASAFHQRRSRQVAAARTAASDSTHHAVLERLTAVVGRPEASLFETCVEAVLAGATLGEITRAVRIEDQPDAAVTPVPLTRAAAGFERLRAAVDSHTAREGLRPGIFLASMGPPRQHRARADFARGFFEAAGFRVVQGPGFDSPEDAAAAAARSDAVAACICSTDETYPDLVPPFARAYRAARPKGLILLAGHPPDQVEAHRAAGVDEFIHIRANALEVLSGIARRMGVEILES